MSGATRSSTTQSRAATRKQPVLEPRAHETESAVDGAKDLSGRDVLLEGTGRERPGHPPEGPVLHPDLVRRAALLKWFSAHRAEPVVAIFAPAGYGKTTLLGQAAEADAWPFAWVSLEDGDNDPVALMTHVAQGLDRIVKVGPAVFEALRFPATALWSTTVPRLGMAIASIERPAVIVLDDVHLLCNRDCLDIVAAIRAYLPAGSQLVLAGRQEPELGLARLRAERSLAELGKDELAFDVAEAGALLRAVGVDLTESAVAELATKTEGWAAGLYLASLSLGGGGSLDRDARSTIGGRSSHIAEYLRSEVLSRMTSEHVDFLTRTAVLERMCGPLCDVVLDQRGSVAMLELLHRSNRFVVALDAHGEWYRYHDLFRELLFNELGRREPSVISALCRRAAEWCAQHSEPEAAVNYALSAGELERAAMLVMGCIIEVYQSGRLETARKWVDRLSEAGLLERYPAVAIMGAWAQGLSGHPAESERLAAVAERGVSEGPLVDGSATLEPWVATLRANMCRHGVERMAADAQRALELVPEWSFWRSTAAMALGISFVLAGDDDRADEALADAVEVAAEVGMNDDRSIALAERSLLAAGGGDLHDAERFAQEAQRVVVDAGLGEYMTSAITYAALGRVELQRRELVRAREQFVRADRLRPLLTRFMPFLGVQVRIELVRERLALADPDGARILLREVEHLLRVVPALGVLGDRAAELRGQVDAMRSLGGDVSQLLTEAELRVLPLLASHLTIAEIADRQFVSRATIKTQSISIYRKLDVTSRREAVERAAEVGLIDHVVLPPKRDFHPSG